jgi:hypothetical protein
MIIDNLKARCVDVVARELARPSAHRRHFSVGDHWWASAVEEQRPYAAAKINEMTNMELLDLISEVLVSD